MSETQPRICHLFCNQCQRNTRHEYLADVSQKDSEIYAGFGSIDWSYTYQILQCRGCNNVTYHTEYWNSEDADVEEGPFVQHTYYPPMMSRPKPAWVQQLDSDIQLVLEEVYTSFYHSLRYLTAVGARTILDMMIVSKIGDIGTFQQKIDKLRNDGHITDKDKELIATLTETGNAAAHRGYAPSIKNLASILGILEVLLHKFYIQEATTQELLQQAQRLKAGVPKRQKP